MILFKNADITVYNKYYDFNKDCDMYQRTFIKGVNWQGKRNIRIGSTLNDSGVKTDDTVLILIDKLNNYLSPKKFNREVNKNKYFTLTPGDKIVKGECDFVYTGVKGGLLKDLENNYDDVIDILGVMSWSQHFEVEGK